MNYGNVKIDQEAKLKLAKKLKKIIKKSYKKSGATIFYLDHFDYLKHYTSEEAFQALRYLEDKKLVEINLYVYCDDDHLLWDGLFKNHESKFHCTECNVELSFDETDKCVEITRKGKECYMVAPYTRRHVANHADKIAKRRLKSFGCKNRFDVYAKIDSGELRGSVAEIEFKMFRCSLGE